MTILVLPLLLVTIFCLLIMASSFQTGADYKFFAYLGYGSGGLAIALLVLSAFLQI